MKINNLKEGMILKNYKELCKVLEIKVAAGNTRTKQLNALSEGVEYHKEGNKFIIDKIIGRVDMMDKRKLGNNNDISKNLRYMILEFLSKHELKGDDVCIGFSKIMLYRYCGMINDNFRNAKGNRQQWAKTLNVTELAVEECLDYTDDRLSATLRRACSTLCNTNKAFGYRFGYNYIIKNGKNNLDVQYTADIETENIIRDIENKIMKEMKINKYDIIYKLGRWNEFKNRVIHMLKSEYSLEFKDLKYYYNAVVFNYKNETIIRTISGFEEAFGLNKELAKSNVNKFFINSLDKTIDNRHNKSLESHKKDIVTVYRADDLYKVEQKNVKNSIIIRDYEQLSFDAIIDDSDESIPF